MRAACRCCGAAREAGDAPAYWPWLDVLGGLTRLNDDALVREHAGQPAVGVVAQIPCRFCIIAHTEFAKLNGVTDAESNEAIARAALTRDLDTLLNGMQIDETQFRTDIERIVKDAPAAAESAAKRAPTAAR